MHLDFRGHLRMNPDGDGKTSYGANRFFQFDFLFIHGEFMFRRERFADRLRGDGAERAAVGAEFQRHVDRYFL